MCRHCNQLKVFYNRCNLLCHIRSHAFKTATINVTDIKVESLPLNQLKTKVPPPNTSSGTKQGTITKPLSLSIRCQECKADIMVSCIAYKDRANHFMQYTNEVYSCPVCLFALPNICALKVHLRLHLRCPPYFCPECGVHLNNKNLQYPYNHDCEGFKMMRATARLNCSVPDCSLFHPNDYKEHMTKYHLKKVYKCPFCVVACFNESTMEKHLKGHKTDVKPLLFYQCDVCPGRYVLQNQKFNDLHLKSHINTNIFPCWACGSAFKAVSSLLNHFIMKHNKSDSIKDAINALLNDSSLQQSKPKRIYRVVKRCEQCRRSFTYKCKYEEIQGLPNECPFKCSSMMESNVMPEKLKNYSGNHITCHICRVQVLEDWTEIKKHYAALHKTHKCLDAEILLTRIDIGKYLNRKNVGRPRSKKRNLQKISKKTKHQQLNQSSTSSVTNDQTVSMPLYISDDYFECNMCDSKYEEKTMLEEHMLSHKDSHMAYQCMECAQNFVVKSSFANHLLLEHNVTDPDEYIKNRQCSNENSLAKHQNTEAIIFRENQCRICLDEFDDLETLEKHCRVHGMAFLVKSALT